jgi:glycosyltransferase involved in cell wall biosynthesis
VDYSEDGRTGFSYTPTDVSGFAEGISRLKSCGEGLRSDIGAYNRQVAKKFDIAHVLELMRELYEETLS